MQPQLILFDIDGTLIDTGGAGRKAIERACRLVFGIDEARSGTARVRFAGLTDPVILESFCRALGVAPERLEAHREALLRSFLLELKAELSAPEPRRRVLPGVRELLEELARRDGVYLGLATGNIESGAWAKLEALGLDGFFADGGFASDHADRRELARRGWLKLCKRFGIEFPARRVTIVGDTERDVDSAHANGFRVIAVDSGWVPRERLERAKPDWLLDDLSDTAQVLDCLGLAVGGRSTNE
jgi:phosphoglycolate phosphatase-like HAD superfamily hydrolase